MWDKDDQLKADLVSILDAGPSAVSADEAVARARIVNENPDTIERFGFSRSRRRGGMVAVVSFAVVICLLVGLLITDSHSGGSRAHVVTPGSRLSSAAEAATNVPASVFEKIGLPSEIVNHPKKVTGRKELVTHGLPEVLYMWASYCPFCAAENWALVMALSRFGTFTRLNTTSSSVSGFAPDTRTLSFYESRYSSPYLKFDSYDLSTNKPATGAGKCNVDGYSCLQTAPAADAALMQTIGPGGFPFVDFNNESAQDGASFENQPLILKGLTVAQIASQLSDPNDPVALAEVGSANYLIGAICAMTGDRPAGVCSSKPVRSAQAKEGLDARLTAARAPVLGAPTYYRKVLGTATSQQGVVTGRVWACAAVIASKTATISAFLHGRLAAKETVVNGGRFRLVLPSGSYELTGVGVITGPGIVPPHAASVQIGKVTSIDVPDVCI
jgi:hypothetical protein